MENPDSTSKVSANSGASAWARLEGNSGASRADLQQSAHDGGESAAANLRRTFVCGVLFYLALSVLFAAVCFCCNQPRSLKIVDPVPRYKLDVPKYVANTRVY